jgi:hypothetical protein
MIASITQPGLMTWIPLAFMLGAMGIGLIAYVIIINWSPSWTRDVKDNGQKAMATVVNINDTSMDLGRRNFYVTLHLRVQPSNNVPFEISLDTRVSRVAIPRVGDTYMVKYDPENRDHLVLLDWANTISTGTSRANMTQELTHLAELHRKGDLSDAEYAAAKRKLIGGL